MSACILCKDLVNESLPKYYLLLNNLTIEDNDKFMFSSSIVKWLIISEIRKNISSIDESFIAFGISFLWDRTPESMVYWPFPMHVVSGWFAGGVNGSPARSFALDNVVWCGWRKILLIYEHKFYWILWLMIVESSRRI